MDSVCKRLVLSSISLLLVSCSFVDAELGRELEFEPVPELPEDWGDYGGNDTQGDDCPAIAGVYEPRADIVTINEGTVDRSRSDEFVYYSLFVGPLAGESEDIDVDDTSQSMTISTRVDAALRIEARGPDGRRIAYGFPQTAGGRMCEDGFFRPTPTKSTGNIEGTTLNGQKMAQFTSLGDGSLLYYEQFGPRQAVVGDGRGFTHVFYRFRLSPDSVVNN